MLIWDIETGPLDGVRLAALCPAYEPPPHPGEFDPAAVKYGNTKDPDKRSAILADNQARHSSAVESYERDCKLGAEQHFADFKSKAALDATTGRVLCVGFQSGDTGKVAIIDGDGDESKLLTSFWDKYRSCRSGDSFRSMVGCNIFSFDLPFLVRRSWILGVEVPDTVIKDSHYWDARVFVDLRNVWLLGQRWGECESKLDTMARALGVGAKNGNGADFAGLWASDREKAVAYLRNDLQLTCDVAKRLGVI